jgi:tetratricopeptide (TPR) repeat protein
VSEPQEYALARAVQPPPAPRQVEPAPRPAAPEPPVEAEVPPMQVTRRPEADPLFRQIERAYLAYQDGDLGRAQALYRGVLARDPRNRDALLGMAAVALQAGRPQEAQQAYLRILQVNPRDRAAQAALGALQGGADPRQGESRLKGLLAEEPGAAYLHFNLGNLYAAQSRWAEAQDAYFNAFRLDSRNPDYAFNLAVSLDHLGKARPALDHYELALDLAGERRPRFDRGVVASRVQSLRERVSAPLP